LSVSVGIARPQAVCEVAAGVAQAADLSVPRRLCYTVLKRAFDLVLSAVAVIILMPLLASVAVALLLAQGRPILFRQKRAGLAGKPFWMLKFRTMVNGAEACLPDVAAVQDLPSGPCFKSTRDPRVTRFGRILRKWSIDELPQLFNVLAGHMSLVGPRPLPLYEVNTATQFERIRLSVKPGITCLWQIAGRNEVPYDEWMMLDALYVRHRSLWLDMLILLKTIPAVLCRRGAF